MKPLILLLFLLLFSCSTYEPDKKEVDLQNQYNANIDTIFQTIKNMNAYLDSLDSLNATLRNMNATIQRDIDTLNELNRRYAPQEYRN